MSDLAKIFIVINALLHVNFMILEMILWTKPFGLKTFKQTAEKAEITKVLAMNQGLYNGFLAAGLFWALYLGSSSIACFFLICIFIAGIFGAITASRTILYVQAIPSLLALLVLHFF